MKRAEYPLPLRTLIEELKRLPGIGARSAERIALWMLQSKDSHPESLGRAIAKVQETVRSCTQCGFFTETDPCALCSDPGRDRHFLCIVEQPTDISYTPDTTATTCFGQCDGMIELTEVDGSFGGFTYSINSITANCAGSCNGNSAQYLDVCAGNYEVRIRDQSGCYKDVDFTVEQPEPVEFEFTVTNVTCYTFGDGKATVDGITGGTEPFFISLNEKADYISLN
jgi:hypothetical protein